ncbi:MAG TPA: hypothetical protein VIP77_19195 [Jiangellaceae bacterium]
MAADDGSSGTATSPFQQVVEAAESVARILSASITALKEAEDFVDREFPADQGFDRAMSVLWKEDSDQYVVAMGEMASRSSLTGAVGMAESALGRATEIAGCARAARAADTLPDAAREFGSATNLAQTFSTDFFGYQLYIKGMKGVITTAEGRQQRRNVEDGAESWVSGSRLRTRTLLALEKACRLGQGLPEAVTRVTEAVSAATSAVEDAQAT